MEENIDQIYVNYNFEISVINWNEKAQAEKEKVGEKENQSICF